MSPAVISAVVCGCSVVLGSVGWLVWERLGTGRRVQKEEEEWVEARKGLSLGGSGEK